MPDSPEYDGDEVCVSDFALVDFKGALDEREAEENGNGDEGLDRRERVKDGPQEGRRSASGDDLDAGECVARHQEEAAERRKEDSEERGEKREADRPRFGQFEVRQEKALPVDESYKKGKLSETVLPKSPVSSMSVTRRGSLSLSWLR